MHFYQFHIGDYKSHTHHLSLIEDLAFRRLLDHYYLHELPIRQREIARQIGMKEHEQEVLTVLEEFFLSTDDGYIHPRADAEIAKYRKLSEDGKRGAAKRWVKGGDSPPIATPIATNNQEPITKNQGISQDKPAKPKRKTSIPDDFSVSKRVADWAAQKGFDRLDEHLDAFTRKAKMNAYTYMDWDLAFMEAIREDWAKLRGKQSYAQQAADIARVTVPAAKGPDPALVKIEQDAKKAAPMPAHIRQQINSVLRKV